MDRDKAIEIVKSHYPANKQMLNEALEFLIPELKESEDEKIRKQIISFLKEFEYDHYRNLNFSSWISWLEKQGNKPQVENDQSNGIWHTADETPVGPGDRLILVLFEDSGAMVVPVEDWESLERQLKWAYIKDLTNYELK